MQYMYYIVLNYILHDNYDHNLLLSISEHFDAFASFGEGQLTCRTLHRLQSQQKPLPSSFSILLVKESLTGT